MSDGSATWSYDCAARAWYFRLDERSQGPYRSQIVVKAILDIDNDGRLAGVEIIDQKPDGTPIMPPLDAE